MSPYFSFAVNSKHVHGPWYEAHVPDSHIYSIKVKNVTSTGIMAVWRMKLTGHGLKIL